MRAKEHWIWNQDLLPLVLDLPLTHGSPWADPTLKLSLHGETGEMICFFFPPTNLTPVHTHNVFINKSNLGSWGRRISGMFCFVSFATAAFHPPEFYFFTVFVSVKTPEFQKHLYQTTQKCL